MTLHNKVGGAWKELSSLHVKINGEWKDINTMYSKKDGAWVVVYSSGALIEFMDYPYAIPVASGWQYSTDGKTWITVSEDGEIDGSDAQAQYYDFSGISISAFTEGVEGSGYEAVNAHVSGIVQLIDGVPTTIRAYWDFGTTEEYADTNFSGGDANFFYDATSTGFPQDNTPTRLEVLDSEGNVVQTHIISGDGMLPFTGYVKAKGELNLSEYYTRTDGFSDIVAESGLMKRVENFDEPTYAYDAFSLGDKAWFTGGWGNESSDKSALTYTYSSSGTRSMGTSLSYKKMDHNSFVLNNQAYVTGGFGGAGSYSYLNLVDIFDISGTRTSGTTLSANKSRHTCFTVGSIGIVAGGIKSSSSYEQSVNSYTSSSSRTTLTKLTHNGQYLRSFVLGDVGYICGFEVNSSYWATVDKYNSSGTKSTGVELSQVKSRMSTFTLGDYAYVCGGQYNMLTSNIYNTVDVYSKSGTRTTGTALSLARYSSTSFTLGDYGYVCGGQYPTTAANGGSTTAPTDRVDKYDKSGVRTTGKNLSMTKGGSYDATALESCAFVGGCGSTDYVEMYYDTYEPLYYTDIPITEGSTYTLNGESGTAEVSEVLTFDSKVTGTIKYKKGDLSPAVQLTVVDAFGNVVEGAEITIAHPPIIITVSGVYSDIVNGDSYAEGTVSGMEVYPDSYKLVVNYTMGGNSFNASWIPSETNTMGGGVSLNILAGSATIDLYDSKGNLIVENVPYEVINNTT